MGDFFFRGDEKKTTRTGKEFGTDWKKYHFVLKIDELGRKFVNWRRHGSGITVIKMTRVFDFVALKAYLEKLHCVVKCLIAAGLFKCSTFGPRANFIMTLIFFPIPFHWDTGRPENEYSYSNPCSFQTIWAKISRHDSNERSFEELSYHHRFLYVFLNWSR